MVVSFGNYELPLDIFKNIAYRVDNISKINQLNRQIHSVVDQSDDIWLKFIENKWCPFDLAKEFSGKQDVKDVLRYYFTDLRRLNDVERVYRLDPRVTCLALQTTAFEHVPAAQMDDYVGRLATQIKNGLNPSLKTVYSPEEGLNSQSRAQRKFIGRHAAAVLIGLAGHPMLQTLSMRGFWQGTDYQLIWAALAVLLESRPPKLDELTLWCSSLGGDNKEASVQAVVRATRAIAGLAKLHTFELRTYGLEGILMMLDHCPQFQKLKTLVINTIAGKGKGVLSPEYSEKMKQFFRNNPWISHFVVEGWKIEEMGDNVLRDIVLQRPSETGFPFQLHIHDKKWNKQTLLGILEAFHHRCEQEQRHIEEFHVDSDLSDMPFPKFGFIQGAKAKTFEGIRTLAKNRKRYWHPDVPESESSFQYEVETSNGPLLMPPWLIIQKINDYKVVEEFFYC